MTEGPALSRSLFVLVLCAAPAAAADPPKLEAVRVGKGGTGFVLGPSGQKFVPWGFNYDHDAKGRLIEDYWHDEWDAVAGDFAEMKQLGANVVRVHLQFGRFMAAADKPNEKSLARLGDLLRLAEKEGLYLDLTGLGCYHKADVPDWYDKLSEAERWAAQAKFWEAVAGRCQDSPAVFCYDLMNEPVVSGGKRQPGDWLAGAFAGKHFVQFVNLDGAGRERPAVARAWVKTLVPAIRKHDPKRLITVGLVDWSLDRPGLTSGFVPKAIVDDLDFLAVHLYPRAGKADEAIETLRGFAVGKPVLVEETFPLKCSAAELEAFLEKSEGVAAGWIGFYWGQPPAALRKSKAIGDAITLGWLEVFEKRGRSLGVIGKR